MKMRNFLFAVAAACMVLVPFLGQAADWSPRGAIKLQIGFGAGGSTDIMGRLIAAQVKKDTGWNIIVENKPGGGGVALFSSLMRKKPDGLTLGVGVNIPIILNLAKRGDKIPFKINSFDYIGTILKGENALVAKADAPFDNLKEFLEYAKSKSKHGVPMAFDAAPQKMIWSAVSKQAHVKFKYVKHKSGAEQIQSLLGGHVAVGNLAGAHIKYLKSGDLKMIAVLNQERHSYALNVKTLIQSGFNFYLEPYYYIAAPKGLPSNVSKALVKAFDKAIYSDTVKKALYNTLVSVPYNLGPEGTFKMLSAGVTDIKTLIDAGQ